MVRNCLYVQLYMSRNFAYTYILSQHYLMLNYAGIIGTCLMCIAYSAGIIYYQNKKLYHNHWGLSSNIPLIVMVHSIHYTHAWPQGGNNTYGIRIRVANQSLIQLLNQNKLENPSSTVTNNTLAITIKLITTHEVYPSLLCGNNIWSISSDQPFQF